MLQSAALAAIAILPIRSSVRREYGFGRFRHPSPSLHFLTPERAAGLAMPLAEGRRLSSLVLPIRRIQ
ncbi:hypothetical protein D3877_09565 [Azospirillum cavernae]|uniref:Uncharacterized protein n=1 Tax=Azospirillum cavernae TaxID=2320860 RepID=A0A418W3Z0_9PROT|nr:hypothetical protein D3877_09565 [Azospirillum cavernae]